MRDGTKLHTEIYSPKDKSKTYPILLKRTPYSCSPYGEENYKTSIAPDVMEAAEQDARLVDCCTARAGKRKKYN